MTKKPRGKKKELQELLAENRKLVKKLRDASTRDPLTGLYSYQYFMETLDIEIKHAKQYMFPMSVILLDIDYFRSINDTYGHRTGNKILRQFGQFLKQFVRDADIITRYVGAGFAIIMANTPKANAIALAQRLCENVQRRSFQTEQIKIKLKVSIGVVSYPENGISNVAGLIDALDKTVINAKDQGGNRLCTLESLANKEKAALAQKDDVQNLRTSLKMAGKKLDQALLESIYAFAKAIEARDHYTGEHAENMIVIVRGIGKELDLPPKMIKNLEHAAVLHDLGKIGIDDKILRKKGKLTKKEYEEIKKHPVIGAEILRSIHFLKDVVPYILYHHERFDGFGYVSGLKGTDIPLGARILAVADVFQALISDRPYRKAFPRNEAVEIVKEGSGTQFDPAIVKAFLKAYKKGEI